MPWTQFSDMHSGGGTKIPPYERIYIEASADEAKVIFYNRFGRSPERVTCTCCGEDYAICEDPTLQEASAYHRNCKFVTVKGEPGGGHYVEEPCDSLLKYGGRLKDYKTVEQYTQQPDVLIIAAADIKPEERTGEVPQEGYVWR